MPPRDQTEDRLAAVEARLAALEGRLAVVEARPYTWNVWGGYQCGICNGWVPPGTIHRCGGSISG